MHSEGPRLPSTEAPPPSAPPHTLDYGTTPLPGRITLLDQPDGSVTILIPRRPLWLPLTFAGLLFLLAFVTPLVFYLRSGLRQLLVIPLATLGTLILLLTLIAKWGQEEFRIHAGPDGLRVAYTDSGDEVRLDLPRAAILDVREPSFTSADKNNLIITTTAGKKFVQVFRSRRDLRKIAAAARRGLGLPM